MLSFNDTETVMRNFISRLRMEMEESTGKMNETKGSKRCRKSGSLCCVPEEEKEDYVIPKAKKPKKTDNGKKKKKTNKITEEKKLKGDKRDPNIVKLIKISFKGTSGMPEEIKISIGNRGTKRLRETGSLAEEEKQDKQKKPKICDNEKKKPKTNKITKEKKDPNIVKFTDMGLEPPPDMPQEFKDRIQNLGGTDIKLIIQKFIQGTDLTSGHNRLSMSLRQVRNDDFLNEEERAQLNQKKPKAIEEVMFVEPCGEVSTLNLTRWEIGASPSYILNGPWHKKVVMNKRNDLKPKAVVQIWSFRSGPDSKLGFAMIKVADGEEKSEGLKLFN